VIGEALGLRSTDVRAHPSGRDRGRVAARLLGEAFAANPDGYPDFTGDLIARF
jgi:hypothetical protein